MTSSPTPWRLLVTPDREPAFNMALDEALLLSPGSPPTVRFYTWRPPAISLGWFQDAAEVEPLPPGVDLVRRITGGLAIHHYREFTWSLVGPENLFPGPVEASYRRLHAALVAAIHRLGAAGIHLREEEQLLSEGGERSPWCFERSSPLDLVGEGRKLAGSAQRRREGRLLHHGSLPLEENPLTPRNTWVSRLAGRSVGFAEMGHAFAATLAVEQGVELAAGELTGEEESLARRLVVEKHANPAHLHRAVRRQRPGGCGISDQE